MKKVTDINLPRKIDIIEDYNCLNLILASHGIVKIPYISLRDRFQQWSLCSKLRVFDKRKAVFIPCFREKSSKVR